MNKGVHRSGRCCAASLLGLDSAFLLTRDWTSGRRSKRGNPIVSSFLPRSCIMAGAAAATVQTTSSVIIRASRFQEAVQDVMSKEPAFGLSSL